LRLLPVSWQCSFNQEISKLHLEHRAEGAVFFSFEDIVKKD
jgi:hypothetical protein